MQLDRAVLDFLATKPDSGAPDAPVADRRRAILAASDELFDRFGQQPPSVAERTDHDVAVPYGSLRVRVYRPETADGDVPVHVFLHGGGFWLGSAYEDVVDATCRERCAWAQTVVVSVEYRLAPEHPFPAAIEDGYAALVWTHQNAAAFGGNPDRLSIGGVSAGGGLAAAVALLARDRQGPQLALQLLEVPALDLTLETMRASAVGDQYGITVAEMQLCAELYLTDPAAARTALASPLLAADLSGLPPAMIMTAQFDPLRDDGARYAARLDAAGVPVTHFRQPGAVHGSLALTGTWEPARDWRARVVAALSQVHPVHSTARPSTDSALPGSENV